MPRFAAVQMEPQLLQPDANIEKIHTFLEEAALHGADVVVFPECATTGYGLTPEEAESVAQPVPGTWTARLSEACRQTGVQVVALGTLEVDSQGHLFNTSVLLGPEGVIARYRKTHLPYLGVDRYLAAGDEILGPYTTPVGKLASLICYDIRFPEPARVLALAGTQVILISTAWPQAATLYPEFLIQTRAAENHLYVVAANRIGDERGARYLGHSLIVAPDGVKLAEASGDREEILYADLDPTLSDHKRLIFAPGEYELDPIGDRRPELYRSLVESPARTEH
jgi:predicted amidohydrolase